jgi:hypothetical protein
MTDGPEEQAAWPSHFFLLVREGGRREEGGRALWRGQKQLSITKMDGILVSKSWRERDQLVIMENSNSSRLNDCMLVDDPLKVHKASNVVGNGTWGLDKQ